MKERLNITKSLVNKEIKDNWSLKELVNFIKNPSKTHMTKVKASRELFKVCKDSYDKVKLSFPCFIPNFTFKNNYVKGSNLDSPTGYLYIDIDDTTDIDLSSPYIVAYWKSLSFTGYSVIVSVSGLNRSNLKESTKHVSKLLNLPLDSCAISVDRNVIISYDKDAFYTDSYKTIDLTSIVPEIDKVCKPVLTIERRERVKSALHSKGSNRKLVTNTLQELIDNVEFNGELIFDLGECVEFATIGSRFLKVPKGKRNSSLFFMGCQLKALNTWAEIEDMIPYMKTINKDGMQEPVSIAELYNICRNVIKKYLRGELKVYNNRKRRFLFNPEYELTTKQKQSLIGKYISDIIPKRNKKKIKDFVKETGITNRTKIAESVGLSRKTVIKYMNIETVENVVETKGIINPFEISQECNIKENTVKYCLEELGY